MKCKLSVKRKSFHCVLKALSTSSSLDCVFAWALCKSVKRRLSWFFVTWTGHRSLVMYPRPCSKVLISSIKQFHHWATKSSSSDFLSILFCHETSKNYLFSPLSYLMYLANHFLFSYSTQKEKKRSSKTANI